MKQQRGFTVIELLVVIVAVLAVGYVAWNQINTLQTMDRDDKRRTSINAIYCNLEEIYYKQHSSYPKTLTDATFSGMDKSLLKDPAGVKIGQSGSDFRYEPISCSGDECKGYTLRTSLEGEADFIKTNLKH